AALARESDALILLGPRYTPELAKKLAEPGHRLRLLQFLSAGYENAESFGVPQGTAVSNGSSIWAPAVAEHAVALMLGLLRRLPELERNRTSSTWDREGLAPRLGSLDGARVGILGYGTIGREIAQRVRPFGAEPIGIARTAKADEFAPVAGLAELQTLIPTLDVLINGLPSTATTRHLVGEDVLGRLKPRAILVNVGRGSTTDEAALYEALADGRIAGAGLDVSDVEPLALESPLWSLANVIISPHCAGYGSVGIIRRAHELCRANLTALRDGAPCKVGWRSGYCKKNELFTRSAENHQFSLNLFNSGTSRSQKSFASLGGNDASGGAGQETEPEARFQNA
ncbi:D-2-hydroxyacid dehydrogenase, partial [Paracoccus sp. PXZ]